MCVHYLIKEEGESNDTFAIVLERTRTQETLNAIRIAINEEFNCYCKPGDIDLEEVKNGFSQILHVTAPATVYKAYMEINIAVSTAPLY